MTTLNADIALLDQYRACKDEQAFAEIVQRYAGVVFTTSHRILRDRQRAEEVAQETFLRLMHKPQSVTRSLGGWLHRVATQLSIDVVRSDSARRDRERTYSEANPREVSRWEELSPIIDEALAEVDEDQRDLLVRHFLSGVAQAELAEQFDTSAATMSRRIKSAVEALRQRLRHKGLLAGAAMIGAFFHNGPAAAAPATLMTELGKMAMVSGIKATADAAAVSLPRTSPIRPYADGAVTATGQVAAYAAAAFVIAAIATIILTLVAPFGRPDAP